MTPRKVPTRTTPARTPTRRPPNMVALTTSKHAESNGGTTPGGSGRVAVVAGVRTPLVKAGANFRNMHMTELARVAIQESLYRSGLSADELDEVIFGNVVMPVDA